MSKGDQALGEEDETEIREERAVVEGVEGGGEAEKCIIIDTSQLYSGIWNVLIEIQWDTESYTSII